MYLLQTTELMKEFKKKIFPYTWTHKNIMKKPQINKKINIKKFNEN